MINYLRDIGSASEFDPTAYKALYHARSRGAGSVIDTEYAPLTADWAA